MLCCAVKERDHLFFNCDYTSEVLKLANDRFQCIFQWKNAWFWMASMYEVGKVMKEALCLLLMIYLLWAERNYRVHRGIHSLVQQLVKNTLSI